MEKEKYQNENQKNINMPTRKKRKLKAPMMGVKFRKEVEVTSSGGKKRKYKTVTKEKGKKRESAKVKYTKSGEVKRVVIKKGGKRRIYKGKDAIAKYNREKYLKAFKEREKKKEGGRDTPLPKSDW